MALSIMAAPPLPSRNKSSIRGRPLPSTPPDETPRNRALPSLPTEQPTTGKPPSPRGPRLKKTASVRQENEQVRNRPLPPPPDSSNSDSQPNNTSTLKRGLPPVPNGDSVPNSTNTGTLKRPLPPTPSDSQPSLPPSRSGSGSTLPRRPSTHSHEPVPQLPARRLSNPGKQLSCEEGKIN